MSTLDDIKASHTMVGLVETAGIILQGQGRVRQGLCPFHEEAEGSFTVYTDTQRFYCFGCKAKGDVVDFVQMLKDLDFKEAMEYLGTMPATGHNVRPAPVESHFDSNPPLLTVAAEYYRQCYWKSPEAQEYLKSRGIDGSLVNRLSIGFSTGEGLRRHLSSEGFTPGEVRDSGLIVGQGNERFHEMITVPDGHNGQVHYLVGRTIHSNGYPRFQNLPGTKPVLGLERLDVPKWVILTEGLFDWLALMGWRYPVCATLGAHTLDRVVQALEHVTYVVLAFDNDGPGIESVIQLESLIPEKAIRIEHYEGAKDVAELLTNPDGPRVFHTNLIQAIESRKGELNGSNGEAATLSAAGQQ